MSIQTVWRFILGDHRLQTINSKNVNIHLSKLLKLTDFVFVVYKANNISLIKDQIVDLISFWQEIKVGVCDLPIEKEKAISMEPYPDMYKHAHKIHGR